MDAFVVKNTRNSINKNQHIIPNKKHLDYERR